MAIDSRLRWLAEERSAPTGTFGDAMTLARGAGAVEESLHGAALTDVLVRATPAADPLGFATALQKHGLDIHTIGGAPGRLTATGTIEFDDLFSLDADPMVARIEASRDLQPELLVSLPDCGAAAAHALAPPVRGRGALVGVIDSGIDWRHPVFLGAGGKTRIVALWDQSASMVSGGSVKYGRVHTAASIDLLLGTGVLPHRDSDGHGTHVTSIAAGSAPRDGVAPEAGVLLVALASNGGQTLGRSMNAIDAFAWIVEQADALERPVAINMSQGMNGGGHCGASVLEVAMDTHCRSSGIAIVKSAGNEQEWRIHASGVVAVNAPLTFEVVCQAQKRSPGHLEIWHDALDDLEIRVLPPSGPPTPWVNMANVPQTFAVAGANRIRVDTEFDAELTGDDLINVFFAPGGSALGILPGTWRVELRATRIGADGRVHGWLERTARNPASEQLRFSPASSDPSCTISIPGTARRVITVGSYVSTPDPPGSALVGAPSTFSSHGPTRHGVRKPDLVAPGEWIDAARSAQSQGSGSWVSLQGTSMAAPHVAGAAAILLSEDPMLTGEQIRQILTASARAMPSGPNDQVGHGRLDVARALALLRGGGIVFPIASNPQVQGTRFEISTQSPTTASLLYDTHRGKLLAGRRTGSLASLAPTSTHVFDLSAAGPGTWHFEVHLFSATWRTIADDDGTAWSITVP